MHSCHHSGSVFRWPIFILIFVFIAELTGGLLFNSLGLLGDSVHVFSDIFSLLLAFTAVTIAHKKQPNEQFVYGYHRLEVLSALVNGLLLFGIAILLVLESFNRFQNPMEVNAKYALLIGCIGLIVNLIVLMFFHKSTDHQRDINVKSAYWHIVGDSLASVSVIIGMILIIFTGNMIWDPIITIVIGILIFYGSVRVLLEGTQILMHKSPRELSNIRGAIQDQEHVIAVEELYLWQVCSHLTVGTAHIITDVTTLGETAEISRKIKQNLREQLGVRQITLEFETPDAAKNHSHHFDHEHEKE